MAEIVQTLGVDDVISVRIANQMIFMKNETPFRLPNDVYETKYVYVEGTLVVSLNGLRQREGESYDYVELGDNQQFQFRMSIEPDDEVIVDYIKIL